MKKIFFAALAATTLFTSPASAATFVLNLTGTVSSGSSATVAFAGNQFDFYTIALSGFTPLTLAVGDEVQASIKLDGPLSVGSAIVRNGMDFFLQDFSGASGSTETSGTTDLFLGGSAVVSTSSGAGSFATLFNGYTNFAGTTFSFDEIQSNFTITALDAGTISIDFAGLRTITVNPLVSAVPEPATWAMMLFGFGLVGNAMRRRSATRVSALT
jgi:PEP-CTERM motif